MYEVTVLSTAVTKIKIKENMLNFILPEPKIWWESRNWQPSGTAQTCFLGWSSKMCTESMTLYDEIVHSVQNAYNEWLIT